MRPPAPPQGQATAAARPSGASAPNPAEDQQFIIDFEEADTAQQEIASLRSRIQSMQRRIDSTKAPAPQSAPKQHAGASAAAGVPRVRPASGTGVQASMQRRAPGPGPGPRGHPSAGEAGEPNDTAAEAAREAAASFLSSLQLMEAGSGSGVGGSGHAASAQPAAGSTTTAQKPKPLSFAMAKGPRLASAEIQAEHPELVMQKPLPLSLAVTKKPRLASAVSQAPPSVLPRGRGPTAGPAGTVVQRQPPAAVAATARMGASPSATSPNGAAALRTLNNAAGPAAATATASAAAASAQPTPAAAVTVAGAAAPRSAFSAAAGSGRGPNLMNPGIPAPLGPFGASSSPLAPPAGSVPSGAVPSSLIFRAACSHDLRNEPRGEDIGCLVLQAMLSLPVISCRRRPRMVTA